MDDDDHKKMKNDENKNKLTGLCSQEPVVQLALLCDGFLVYL